MVNSLSRSSITARGSTLQNRAIFSASSLAKSPFGPANQHVRLDADLAQPPTECCVGLVFDFAGRLQIRHQRQVDVQAILLADVEGELADRFEKRQPFDVADGAADLGDDDIDVVGGQACGPPP